MAMHRSENIILRELVAIEHILLRAPGVMMVRFMGFLVYIILHASPLLHFLKDTRKITFCAGSCSPAPHIASFIPRCTHKAQAEM